MVNTPFSRQVLGLVLVLSFLTTACGGEKKQAAAPRAIPVKLQAVEPQSVIDSSDFVGNLVADEFVQLAPQINGRILKVFATYGQAMKRNDPIILLEPTQQQENVNAAVGNVNIQKANLEGSNADLRTVEAQRDAAKSEIVTQQANIANGPQQVNNGSIEQTDSHAKQLQTDQNKLLEGGYDTSTQRMDTRAAQTAERSYQAVEAVGKVHRTQKPRR
jgi:multidrug efflux pump subunit AcrA (membrane-fusion protein)